MTFINRRLRAREFFPKRRVVFGKFASPVISREHAQRTKVSSIVEGEKRKFTSKTWVTTLKNWKNVLCTTFGARTLEYELDGDFFVRTNGEKIIVDILNNPLIKVQIYSESEH